MARRKPNNPPRLNKRMKEVMDEYADSVLRVMVRDDLPRDGSFVSAQDTRVTRSDLKTQPGAVAVVNGRPLKGIKRPRRRVTTRHVTDATPLMINTPFRF